MPFPHLRRNAAANMGAPEQPYTPKTGRAPPGGRGSDAARERFNPHRTAGRGSTTRERTEAAATIPKKLYVNARASAGQGLATMLSKRGREPPAKVGARRDSFKRPPNAATPKAAQAAQLLAGANAQAAEMVAAKTAAPMNDKSRHGGQTTAANPRREHGKNQSFAISLFVQTK